MAEKGIGTSEFKFAGIVGVLTLAAEHINIIDTSAFEGDPVLNLIFRCVQLLVLGAMVVSYTASRTSVKASNGNSSENLIDAVKRNLDQKR